MKRSDNKSTLPPQLATAYLTILAIFARRRLNTDGRASSDKVFVDAQGRTLSNYHYAQYTIEKRSGVKVAPHDLRRTFASIADGLDISGY